MRFRILALLALLALAGATTALAVPLEFAHQGRLLDAAGAPLDGSHTLEFAIYAAPSGGSAIWTEQHAVEFDQGYFTVSLGAITPLDASRFDGSPLFLAMTVDDGAELPGRHALGSVPFAVRAGSAAAIDGGSVDATEIKVNGTTVVSSAGTIDWSTLVNVPAVTDTLAELSCGADQVARFDGSGWGCADAADHDHDAADLATGTIDVARLPIGTGSTQIAAGDHGHSGYLSTSGGALSGGLGIGTEDPLATLDVAGSIRLGDDGDDCDSDHAGTLRWTGKSLDLCDGTAWSTLMSQSPSAIPGLKLWVSADQGVVTSGSQVSTWRDQSGNGNDFTQSTSSRQPSFVTSAINGKPAVRMVASAQQTMTVATNFPPPFTVTYVARMTGGANARVLSGRANNWLLGYHGGSQNSAYHEGWISSGNPGAGTAWNIYTSVGTGSLSTIFHNGTQLYSNANGVAGPNGLSLSGHLSSSEFSNCEVAEILVYSTALSASQRTWVEDYLKAKYGL